MSTLISRAFLIALCLYSYQVQAGTPEYTMVKLESWTRASDINDRGQIVGQINETGQVHAALWDNGQTFDLDDRPSNFGGSTARAINKRGDIAGSRDDGPGVVEAFLWVRGSVNSLSLSEVTLATDINDRLQAVGWYEAGEFGGEDRAYIWQNGAWSDLSVRDFDADGFVHSFAWAINNSGKIVGEMDRRAVLWLKNGQVKDLRIGEHASATDINDKGHIIGNQYGSDGFQRAFFWRQGKVKWLSRPKGFRSSATAINNCGAIVGSIEDSSRKAWAVVWDHGKRFKLKSPGAVSSYAQGINSRGNVVGWITLPNGTTQGVLWRRKRKVGH